MTLAIGKKAPAFTAINQKGEYVSLDFLKGKKVVLFFYPKDDTPTCTTEACDIRDNYERLLAAGFTVLGISPDPIKKHLKFIEKHQLPFDLLSDEDHSMSIAYGVWGEKSMYGRKYMGILRTTFLIDEKGMITDIIDKVVAKEHSAQILPV